MLIAHRGKVDSINKENTILAFTSAINDKKYGGFELDIRETKDKKIVVLDNEKNMGFVRTVNKGMKYSKNDVILLNSDTEVTANWIEKIQNCAYSSQYIATVTPLTPKTNPNSS